MFELLFSSSGIVQMEFVPGGATVNKHRYKEILFRKRPELWCRKNWLLLHNTAPAHCSVPIQEDLAEQQVTVPHPCGFSFSRGNRKRLYGARCDLFLFPRLKEKPSGCGFQSRGCGFHSAQDVVTATMEVVRDLPANIFQQLYQRWQACIEANVGSPA
jgi:hypothetical protein